MESAEYGGYSSEHIDWRGEMSDTEINEAVARNLGWKTRTFPAKVIYAYEGRTSAPTITNWITPEGVEVGEIPDYCHSIAAAWEVVEYCHEEDLIPCVNWLERVSKWHCNFQKHVDGFEDHDAYADTAPMAICLAFLKLEDK